MTFLPQTLKRTRWADVDVRGCLTMFFMGFIKKACIADTLGSVVDAYFAQPQEYNAFSAWMAMLCYAGQIYCDFSGYSDMAIAVARLLGYELTLNFNFPYFSKSITEFWRRWHISLSSWLRDYLYISLGGNRGSKLFTYRNLMLTMVLGGLWHGASWAFIVWGAMHGFALIVHREWANRAPQVLLNGMKYVAVPVTFVWVLLTWVPFRANDVYVEAGTKRPLRSLPDGFYDGSAEKLIYSRADVERDPLTGNWRKRVADNATPPPAALIERRAAESQKGPAEASVRGVAQDPGNRREKGAVVIERLSGSFGTSAMVWRSLITFHDHAKRSVVGNAIVILLAVIALFHWLNSRQYLSTWWRRIPDFLYATLLGAAVAIALFMKPAHYKAFIYFQF
jgi:hypothetical protein